jgi:protoporphyrinogen oxidase
MILILGGGLAGMSTAYHLGEEDHLVLEAQESAGGLCRSREREGFVFDYTGHLLHLRDERAIELVDSLLPDAFDVIERRARIRTRGATLPFPFQANLHGLPREVVADCLVGFAESLASSVPEDPGTSFHDWSMAVFGKGISDAFMIPYNRKLFRRAPRQMTADWVSWAVPKPSLEQVVRGALGIENRGMGYNSTFRYPRQGGIGVLPAALARRVPAMRLGCRVEKIDLLRRVVRVEGGEELAYERLVNTLPLPQFLRMLREGPVGLDRLAEDLDWSVVACLNLGVARADIGDGAHWIYFPDEDVPFYRVGFPSNFSPGVAPDGAGSMYVEFGLGRDEPFDAGDLERRGVEGLRTEASLAEEDRILVRDLIRIDPGYVIFDRSRQEVMKRVIPELEDLGIHSIGRYGAWTYSYMERALLDGIELAQKLLDENG